MSCPPCRVVSSFVLPFDSSATPYNESEFVVSDANANRMRTSNASLDYAIRAAKCIVVGDIAVGKTCLINRFGHDVFGNNYKATIGVDFDVQKFEINSIPLTLQIWDTAGQERFKCITSTYYRGAHAAVIVFDMSSLSTLAAANKWLQEVLDANPTSPPLLFLVGNKRDLLTHDVYSFVAEEAVKEANRLGAEFWTVSAANGHNVHEMFSRIACLALNAIVTREQTTIKQRNENESNFADNFVKLTNNSNSNKHKLKQNCVRLKCN